MTLRVSPIRRRVKTGQLDFMTEVAAAGMLTCFCRLPGEESANYWRGIKQTHGAKITAKVRKAMPGCRPGFDYALGVYPPLPLIEPIPDEHLANRDHIDIEGVRHWYCGGPWQMSQAEHLRAIGELDGAEWKRHLEWKRSGFESRYHTDDDPLGKPCSIVRHCCW
jgi:hypothetical protein